MSRIDNPPHSGQILKEDVPSLADYERLLQRDRRVFSTDALPASLREAIAAARASVRAASFDEEASHS